ncbi:glycosyltransferase [Cohnella sp. CFH 77786]|uniref:glycosyltransferase family 2 protein n=1 Tax=Cohnella sp. CFH 77786 TaxID=2662265 RepID=UPI001C6092F4|nr:glycosyltransferase family 2 protein [Cohnella sp. CFH 77786]MBW5447379.1 glycosyltransferase [Cohnella sp. CFH 77786]
MSARASIIIPTFNGLDLLQRCVESVRFHTADVPYELIVADNASTDGTAEWCLQQKIPFVSLPRNEGFPTACNLGLRLSQGETLVLLNNDTVVTPRWLANLSEALYSAPDIGMVGPVTNYASGAQKVDYPFDNLAEFQTIAGQVNRSDPSKWAASNRIVGFCLVFRRQLMERIGLLDERFNPGHYEDDDYCFRAREQGFRLLICHDALIYHEGSVSFRRDPDAQKQLVERNYRRFMEKWKQDPRAFV